jgi:hypothetical protein
VQHSGGSEALAGDVDRIVCRLGPLADLRPPVLEGGEQSPLVEVQGGRATASGSHPRSATVIGVLMVASHARAIPAATRSAKICRFSGALMPNTQSMCSTIALACASE